MSTGSEINCDVLIVGGGTGGCAAALAATSLGMKVILTEEAQWLGGQLTAQGVPPDEHPWIEQFGCTARYRKYRSGVRDFYRQWTPLRKSEGAPSDFNPGAGWVSNLCHEPRIGWIVLQQMMHGAVASGLLDVRHRTVASGGALLCEFEKPHDTGDPELTHADQIEAVKLMDLDTGGEQIVHAAYVIDATELGDLLALTRTEFVTGAESRSDTHEQHAPEGPAQPKNEQAFTWVFAMGYDANISHIGPKPDAYSRWKTLQPSFWPGRLLALQDLNPQTNEPRDLPLFSDGWRCWFKYRQIVDPSKFEAGYAKLPVTVVNWPQNDYFEGSLIAATPAERVNRLAESRQLSQTLLYWLQTECPRPEGGYGYPGLFASSHSMGTADGFAMTPYIRESRRIVSRTRVVEQDVAAAENPEGARDMTDSVGVGSYRIDLHPSTGGDSYIDLSTLPFQIPLGALVPVRVRNLIPACKNLGVTHITNGCYRLHPVEWNIGEAAGLLASFCILQKAEPGQVLETSALLEAFQKLLVAQGVEIAWPRLKPL